LSLEQMKHNLTAMIGQARARGARVLLVGIELPPNYGRRYTEKFREVYRQVARAQNVPLVPFLLAGVGTDRTLMQADGIHPTPEVQPRMLDNLWPGLRPLL
jgi:acyl-CoA thioesterase-1